MSVSTEGDVVLFACLATVVVAPVLAVSTSRWVGRAAGWLVAVPLLVGAVMFGFLWFGSGGVPLEQSVRWLPTIGVDFALRLDGLALVFVLLVLLIGALVVGYSSRYLEPGRHAWFYVLMSMFAVAMTVLVTTDDLVVLFVAWEATTLCSFFLIARSGPAAREPAVRTLLVTVGGGLSLLAAVVVLANGTGTTRISAVLADPVWNEDPFFTGSVAVLVAVAAFTKSAQFPFQSWLPDSMVAISPVSAYLHAAAMVKAGIYLLLRFSPPQSGEVLWTVLLLTCGLVTALMGAVSALRRHDLKELLAYSTMSQLGLLVALIGVGTPAALTAALVHTVVHAFFKAALFMLVGVIDRQAGTRDVRQLAQLHLRMPVTLTAVAVAALSMAGVPPLLGFVSKESIFAAMVDAPWHWSVTSIIVLAAAATSVLTFAYSGRLVLGALGGRTGTMVRKAPAGFWISPVLCAGVGLVLGLAPWTLDATMTAALASVARDTQAVHLALWHGINLALLLSAGVLVLGTALVVARTRVEVVTGALSVPISGLAIVDGLRARTIDLGRVVGRGTGNLSLRQHLAVPAVCLGLFAVVGLLLAGPLPSVVGHPDRMSDWLLVLLVAVGTAGTALARSRVAAVVAAGIVGFAMTVWFFVLGASDVAMTQLLVEVLTVGVMVLLLRRLPPRFGAPQRRGRVSVPLLALAAGAATFAAVWALTGRRAPSPAADYYVTEGETVTGGANLVNTILVDFRALDTLGELTVLGVAGVAMAALLSSRRPVPMRSVPIDAGSPLADAQDNAVFARTASRLVVPVLVVVSLVLLARGHQEPGGGFIAALVGGAGFALAYLTAPSDEAARVRWPYLALIGTGISIAVLTGFLGFSQGSFLLPLSGEIFGAKLTTALVFDVGVYLAVMGVVLAAFNLLGRRGQTTTPRVGSGQRSGRATTPRVGPDQTSDDRAKAGAP